MHALHGMQTPNPPPSRKILCKLRNRRRF